MDGGWEGQRRQEKHTRSREERLRLCAHRSALFAHGLMMQPERGQGRRRQAQAFSTGRRTEMRVVSFKCHLLSMEA